jgi:hypothetical protein
MKVVFERTAPNLCRCVGRCCRSVGEHREFLGVESAGRASIDPRPQSGCRGCASAVPASVSGQGLLADAVASTTSPWNYGDYDCYDDPYAGRGYPLAIIAVIWRLLRQSPGSRTLYTADVVSAIPWQLSADVMLPPWTEFKSVGGPIRRAVMCPQPGCCEIFLFGI